MLNATAKKIFCHCRKTAFNNPTGLSRLITSVFYSLSSTVWELVGVTLLSVPFFIKCLHVMSWKILMSLAGLNLVFSIAFEKPVSSKQILQYVYCFWSALQILGHKFTESLAQLYSINCNESNWAGLFWNLAIHHALSPFSASVL